MISVYPKPPLPFCPRSQRFLNGGAVTIAAGFFCNEGIVLCADSQETVSGYIKNYTGKMRTAIYDHAIVTLAGAGSTDYINTAIGKALKNLDVQKTLADIQKTLEENLLKFFDKQLTPRAQFPEVERPTVALLMRI